MGNYYLFAFFVFILCIILMCIVKVLFFNNKSNKLDFQNKDEKLLRLYRQIEDMMESFEEYVEEVKDKIEVEKKSIISEFDEIQKKVSAISIEHQPPKEEFKPIVQEVVETNKKMTNKTSETINKYDMVKKLHSEGMGINAIAKRLNMTTAEIKLIIDINV